MLFLLVPLVFISIVPASAEDAQFRANPEHTGMYESGGSEPGNTELWRFSTGGIVYSSPFVADGVVYVGSQDKNVYAIDTVTGTEKWRFTTGDHVFSSPTVADGVVYIGSEDKNLYAVGANSSPHTTVPTTIPSPHITFRVTDTESPVPQAQVVTTAAARQTTRQAPLQYILSGGAIIVAAGIVIRKRQ